MNNIPNKIYNHLGYDALSIILDQERKHWLMKTDKRLQVQDKVTGNMYRGTIDNGGSDIMIESEKLPYVENSKQNIHYTDSSVNKILNVETSTLPYSSMVNGLLYACILSTEYPYSSNGNVKYKNYKIKFTNCSVINIPLTPSITSNNVYAGLWIKTNTPPSIMMLGDDEQYSIERSLSFTNETTNCTWYYPLTETLQPIALHYEGNNTYVMDTINDDGYIGYPAYWFTCDQSNFGPTLSFENNDITNGKLLYISNRGKDSKYNAKIYCNIDGELDTTPDGTLTSNWSIKCTCKTGYTFSGTETDELIPLNNTITFISGITEYEITISNDNNTLYLDLSKDWERENDTATISMSEYDNNCFEIYQTPLIPMLSVHFNESIPFLNTTTDIGFVGIQMSSANPYSDTHDRYPYDLSKWDGIPSWMNDIDDNHALPQHMCIYAIHNTPTYSPSIPDSRQVAALLFDTGTTESNSLTNDDYGRIYYLSNDDIEYHNNATAAFKKPERTLARICDIPTSFTQLSNIQNLAATAVVDKKYVRTEASFRNVDINRLYNDIPTRWVTPTCLDSEGNPITDKASVNNSYVFSYPEDLLKVDLVNHNDFRYYINLNPTINSSQVSLNVIHNGGTGYKVPTEPEDTPDIGTVIVGGFAFNYTVTEVDENGSVTNLTISPSSEMDINISNFDLNGSSGITMPYGTSRLTGNGEGLKFSFKLNDYEDIKTYKGAIYDDLFALVKDQEGLWLYQYIVNNTSQTELVLGQWIKKVLLSESTTSDIIKERGVVSLSDSYINSILPSLRNYGISLFNDGMDPTTIMAYGTASFINVISQDKSPVELVNTSSDPINIPYVDICKWYCPGIRKLRSVERTVQSVINTLKSNNDIHFDSYICWKWLNDNPSDTEFIFGIVKRSFNNFLSTDFTTTLPKNSLTCDNYVHANQSTTVVWDVKNVGPMMWVYNPEYTKKEKYTIDPLSSDVTITKSNVTWENIDFRNIRRVGDVIETYPTLVDDNHNLNYNILTNNPSQVESDTSEIIYQQPEIIQYDELKIGKNMNSISIAGLQPKGNWQLVFPRLNSFKLSNQNNLTFSPIELQTIKGTNLGNGIVTDDDNNNVSNKTLLLDQSQNGTIMKVYNSDTNNWDIV